MCRRAGARVGKCNWGRVLDGMGCSGEGGGGEKGAVGTHGSVVTVVLQLVWSFAAKDVMTASVSMRIGR
jgi:hypothetical protein